MNSNRPTTSASESHASPPPAPLDTVRLDRSAGRFGSIEEIERVFFPKLYARNHPPTKPHPEIEELRVVRIGGLG